MLVTFLRTMILYLVVVFGIRLMGKRQIGELQPSELVITILISNIATLTIEETDSPMFAGLLPILALMCFEVLTSFLCLKSARLRRIVSGRPIIIIHDGKIDQRWRSCGRTASFGQRRWSLRWWRPTASSPSTRSTRTAR